MNWSKAKNIIIAVLIVTNIFILGMNLIRNHQVYNNDADVYQYTKDLLLKNNIYIECELPEAISKMYGLTVSYDKYDPDIVNNIIRDTEPLPGHKRSDADYIKAADEFVYKCGYSDEKIEADSVSETEGNIVVTYKNVYREIPLEECYMTVTFADGKIKDFDRKWMNVVEESSRKIEIIPPVSSLPNFMSAIREEYDESIEIRIQDMYMTYWIDSYSIEDDVLYDTALPAWCFKYNDGKIKYISAIVQ